MKLTRRDFFKVSGATAAAVTVAELGFNVSAVEANVPKLRIEASTATPTICPYCSVGCGILVHADANGTLLSTEGDPDNPVNRGALCSKGSALFQIHSVKVGEVNPKRLQKPLYRAAGASEFQEVEWDWVMEEIVKRVQKTRDENFTVEQDGIPAMRTEAIANMGGAALDNEECYLVQKLARALGIVYIEHQARI